MARRPRVGAFVYIPLDNIKRVYARKIGSYLFSFYVFKEAIQDTETAIATIQQSEPIFSTHIYSGVFNNSDWEVIGHKPLEKKILDNMPVFFRQNQFNKKECWLITTEPGYEKEISPEECINMERESVWAVHHIEERLRDYIANRPNITAERLKVQL